LVIVDFPPKQGEDFSDDLVDVEADHFRCRFPGQRPEPGDQADNTAQILVEVGDCGIGIDPSHAGQLFSAFFTTKADGMGMGLSICRSIIEAHGGRIWALPNDGPGTIFRFTLPAHPADAVKPEVTARHAPA
jgi:signal transduction histidine kinase